MEDEPKILPQSDDTDQKILPGVNMFPLATLQLKQPIWWLEHLTHEKFGHQPSMVGTRQYGQMRKPKVDHH